MIFVNDIGMFFDNDLAFSPDLTHRVRMADTYLTLRTRVPDVPERGESFKSSPALSAGSDLDGHHDALALRVGCISG